MDVRSTSGRDPPPCWASSSIRPPSTPDARRPNKLEALAATHGLPRSSVDDVARDCGVEPFARRRGRELSLGMRQRLGIAMAVLGRPRNLMLDEPLNGLDPEGLRWLRAQLRQHADRGGTVLLSSHQMKEVQDVADDVVVIVDGRVVTHQSLDAFVRHGTRPVAFVHTSDDGRLAAALARASLPVERGTAGLTVPGVTPEVLGSLAFSEGLTVLALRAVTRPLEDVYLAVVEAQRAEYRPRRAFPAPDAVPPATRRAVRVRHAC